MLSVSEMNGLLQVFDRSCVVYYLNAKGTENPAFLVEKVTICFSHGASCWQSQHSAVQLKSFLCILTLRLSILCDRKVGCELFQTRVDFDI